MRDIITHQRETKWLCVSYLHCFVLYFFNSLLRIQKIKGKNIVLKIKKNKKNSAGACIKNLQT